MDYYPPRAEKKYSKTWEYNLNRISRAIVVNSPGFQNGPQTHFYGPDLRGLSFPGAWVGDFLP